jgi:pimeloyl-ACP methyl ester carboxylesterase
VDWAGNAWGGSVGIVFAARWPERCRTLVTLGTPVQSLTLVERARTIGLLIAYRLLGPAGFIRKGVVDTLLSPKTRAQDPAAIALVEDALIHADRGALRNAVVSISLRRRDLTNRLATISVPTLFITGNDHKGWTPQQAVAVSKVLPRGSSAVVADAAYLVPFENPAATIQKVRQFWADHSLTITPDVLPEIAARPTPTPR